MVAENDIKQLINNPSLLNKDNKAWLLEMIEKYPWCSAYRTLLAKLHKNESSYQQTKYLKLASLYAGNRAFLFNFMEDVSEVEVDSFINPMESREVELEVELEVEVEAEEESVVEASEDKEAEVEAEVTEDTLDFTEVSEDKIDFDEIVKYNPLEELKSLEKVEEIKEEENLPLPADFIAYNPETELLKLIDSEGEEDDAHKNEISSVEASDDEHDFFFWLNHTQDDVSEESKKSKEDDIEIGAKSERKTQESIEQPTTQAEEVQSILNKFLENKKAKPKIKRDFYKAEEKARLSEVDDSSVISETLIAIYARQGYLQKAIDGYEKLSLQNPSKSTYFAALIQDLKEKQKESKE